MITLFRETRIGYWIMAWLGYILAFVLGVLLFTSIVGTVVFTVLFVLLWSVLNGAVFAIISSKKFAKFRKIWTDECDVETFVKVLEEVASVRPVRFRNEEAFLFLGLSYGYLTLGKEAEASATLERIESTPNDMNLTNRFYYYQNWFICNLRAGDTLAAEASLKKAQEVLEQSKWREKQKKAHMENFANMQCRLRMKQGDFDGCEAFFLQEKEAAQSKWGKVIANFELGKVYLHENRTKEAQEAFTYVALHGGNSIHQKWAMEQLEAVGKPVQAPQMQKEQVVIFATKEKAVLYSALSAFVTLSAMLILILIRSGSLG